MEADVLTGAHVSSKERACSQRGVSPPLPDSGPLCGTEQWAFFLCFGFQLLTETFRSLLYSYACDFRSNQDTVSKSGTKVYLTQVLGSSRWIGKLLMTENCWLVLNLAGMPQPHGACDFPTKTVHDCLGKMVAWFCFRASGLFPAIKVLIDSALNGRYLGIQPE